jgi:DNA polymerase/3'-5' exonuclease PolX
MKTKYPRNAAIAVARELAEVLTPFCEPDRIKVAGSLRRMKQEVGDVEILYIPRKEVRPVPGDMFASREVDLVDLAVRDLMASGVLEIREGENGAKSYGPKNKFLRHVRTGIPVDLFATIETSWWNYLVCRTGPKESNMAIAEAAKSMGWHWNPYGSGFSTGGGSFHEVTSERDVFEFVGLPYKEPKDR